MIIDYLKKIIENSKKSDFAPIFSQLYESLHTIAIALYQILSLLYGAIYLSIIRAIEYFINSHPNEDPKLIKLDEKDDKKNKKQ